MSYLPSDLTSRVGQEVTLGGLFRTAWRQHKSYFWPAFGIRLLAWLIVLGAHMVVAFLAWMVGMAIMIPLAMKSGGSGSPAYAGGQIIMQVSQQALLVLPAALIGFPLLGGFLWSVVCTYDGRRMRINDLFYGFSKCYKVLAGLGFVYGIVMGAAQLFMLVVVLGPMMAAAGSYARLPSVIPAMLITMVVGCGGWILIALITHLLTYLTPMLPFTQDGLTVWRALRQNWLAVRNRPLTFLVVALFYWVLVVTIQLAVGVPLLLAIIAAVAAKNTAAIVALVIVAILAFLAYLAGVIWLGVYTNFLRAAFLRSVCGYTVSAHPGQLPSPVGQVVFAAAEVTPIPMVPPFQAPGAATAEPGSFTAAPGDQQTFASPEGPDSMQIDPQPEPPQQPPEQEPPEGSW